MGSVEDPATVLEQFIHDVANLPAEIAHLLEEIQAKDTIVHECRTAINTRDRTLQKHVKENGGHVKHHKEEQLNKSVLANYDKAQALQDQKIALAEKAAFLLDRHVKRLDLKIRDLQNDGTMLFDPQLPCILRDSPANLVQPPSSAGTGANTPLHPLAYSAGSSTNVANAAMARMASNTQSAQRGAPASILPGMQPHALLNNGTPGQRHRETSAGASETKRRRLNATLGTLPNPSSNLRQSSLGPGTPRTSTPGSRAGSVGPRSKKSGTTTKKVAPHQQNMRKKITKAAGLNKKAGRRLHGATHKASPSTTGDDSERSGSDDDNASSIRGHDGAADDEDVDDTGYDDEGDDNKLYCTCRSISHGNMIACDNDDCPYEWFHWECVGMTQEPKGRWLCNECSKLPPNKIKVSK